MSFENTTYAFQNAATTGIGLTQFLELLHSGTYYDFIDLNVAGLFDGVGNRTSDRIGRDGDLELLHVLRCHRVDPSNRNTHGRLLSSLKWMPDWLRRIWRSRKHNTRST